METKATNLPQGVTPEEIKKLLAKHKELHPITVKADGRTICGLFKKPTLSILSAAAAAGASDPLKAGEVIYTNCKVLADAEMDTNEEVHLAAITQVNGLFRILQAEVGEPLRAE